MGLSASQARFLQLTARRSNVEYQAQQISFQRLQLANKMTEVSEEYQDKTSNRKMVFSFNNGVQTTTVDVTYTNYKKYINQQEEGLGSTQQRYYLMSSSGNKIVVANEEDRRKMIESHPIYDDTATDEEKKVIAYEFTEDDFVIVDGLDDVDNFQRALQEGDYFFGKRVKNEDTGKLEFKTEGWETMGNNAMSEIYDTTDDAAAEAEFKLRQDKIQNVDKKLEMQLEQLQTERSAIETEIESVSKVIDDNIDSSFKVFS